MAAGHVQPSAPIGADGQADLAALGAAARAQSRAIKELVRRYRDDRAKAEDAPDRLAEDHALRPRIDARAALAAYVDLRRRIAALRGLSGDSRR